MRAAGVGGVRALAAVGIELALVHLNEGHAAFVVLELARAEVARGLPVEAALEVADGLPRLLARPHARLDPHAGSRLLRWADARRPPPADLHADDHQPAQERLGCRDQARVGPLDNAADAQHGRERAGSGDPSVPSSPNLAAQHGDARTLGLFGAGGNAVERRAKPGSPPSSVTGATGVLPHSALASGRPDEEALPARKACADTTRTGERG